MVPLLPFFSRLVVAIIALSPTVIGACLGWMIGHVALTIGAMLLCAMCLGGAMAMVADSFLASLDTIASHGR